MEDGEEENLAPAVEGGEPDAGCCAFVPLRRAAALPQNSRLLLVPVHLAALGAARQAQRASASFPLSLPSPHQLPCLTFVRMQARMPLVHRRPLGLRLHLQAASTSTCSSEVMQQAALQATPLRYACDGRVAGSRTSVTPLPYSQLPASWFSVVTCFLGVVHTSANTPRHTRAPSSPALPMA